MQERTVFLRIVATLVMSSVLFGSTIVNAGAQSRDSKSDDKPVIIDYYYKVKRGYADEFLRLFKKNYYPVLNKQIEMGRILGVTAVSPRSHTPEDGRWDYRVTITFKNSKIAFSDFDPGKLNRELHPDQDAFKREEQRRFDMLLAHWDLPVNVLDLTQK